MSFRFPYNFYPVTGKTNNTEIRYPFDYSHETEENSTLNIARHDVLQKGKLTGTLEYTFTTIAPLVVGNTHKEETGIRVKTPPNIISQYKWREKNAIPANSVRGLIASNLEFLSQSTLRVLDENFHKPFKNIHKDLIPWKNGRSSITVAEAMLGIVDTNGDSANNLSSRVFFHDAITEAKESENSIYLQELASPKHTGEPESDLPFDDNAYNHYFRKMSGEPAKHQDVIRSMNDLSPNGRKFYLKRRGLNDYEAKKLNEGNYNKDYRNRLVKVTPIPEGSIFTGKISFINLSKAELTLLHKSLAPTDNTILQVGLAKSLGLGQIRPQIIKLTIQDDKEKYGLNALSNTHLKESNLATYNDNTLIDKDSLEILINMSSEGKLVSATTVMWRQKEKTRPMPKITTQDTVPPLAEPNEPRSPLNNRPPEKEKHDHGALIEDTSENALWIKEVLIRNNNGRDLLELTPIGFKTLLTGKALSKAFDAIDDIIEKEEVKDKLFAEFKSRSIKPYDFSDIPRKIYFGCLNSMEIP